MTLVKRDTERERRSVHHEVVTDDCDGCCWCGAHIHTESLVAVKGARSVWRDSAIAHPVWVNDVRQLSVCQCLCVLHFSHLAAPLQFTLKVDSCYPAWQAKRRGSGGAGGGGGGAAVAEHDATAAMLRQLGARTGATDAEAAAGVLLASALLSGAMGHVSPARARGAPSGLESLLQAAAAASGAPSSAAATTTTTTATTSAPAAAAQGIAATAGGAAPAPAVTAGGAGGGAGASAAAGGSSGATVADTSSPSASAAAAAAGTRAERSAAHAADPEGGAVDGDDDDDDAGAGEGKAGEAAEEAVRHAERVAAVRTVAGLAGHSGGARTAGASVANQDEEAAAAALGQALLLGTLMHQLGGGGRGQ